MSALGNCISFNHFVLCFMFVYCSNYLYNVSTVSMNVNKRYEWNASEMALRFCLAESTFKNDCNSYITSVVKETNTSYMICASSAKKSACRMLLLDNKVCVLHGYTED